MRTQTRRERYSEKLKTAKKLPVSLATINFRHEGNVAYIIRAAACFGAENVFVIGALPEQRILRALSGSIHQFVNIKCFKNVSEFLTFIKANEIKLVSLEISDDAIPIQDYRFQNDKHTCIVSGNEETGVPTEILMSSVDKIYIPMQSVGYCLNTAQAANIALYEYTNHVLKNLRADALSSSCFDL